MRQYVMIARHDCFLDVNRRTQNVGARDTSKSEQLSGVN